MIHIDKSIPVIHIKGNTLELLNDINNALCNIIAATCENTGEDQKSLLQEYISAIYDGACKTLEVDP